MSIIVKWVLNYDEQNALVINSYSVYHMMPINRMLGKRGNCQVEPITVNKVRYLCSYQPEDNDVVMVAKIASDDSKHGFVNMDESDKSNMSVIAARFLTQKEILIQ